MKVLRVDDELTLTDADGIELVVPAGIYDLMYDQMKGFYLHQRPGFDMPVKIYGGVDAFAQRALKTYGLINRGMAVLLSGPKGCGKTLTAKRICMDAGHPVICLTWGASGPDLAAFLSNIPNNCIVFIDEFEKIYNDPDARNWFLGLLDGSMHNRHLFLLTSNDPDIGECFNNRPGRVRYHRMYDQMPVIVLLEMVRDRVPEGEIRTALEKLVTDYGSMSPDSLASLIEECLLHNELPAQFMEYFNVKDEYDAVYNVTVRQAVLLPKIGLKGEDLVVARQYCDLLENGNEDYAERNFPGGKDLCELREETWEAAFTRPFSRAYDSTDSEDYPWVRLRWAMNSRDQTRTFAFHERDVQQMERKSGSIIIMLKTGAQFVFTKVQK